jgi:general secretion pathway protein D
MEQYQEIRKMQRRKLSIAAALTAFFFVAADGAELIAQDTGGQGPRRPSVRRLGPKRLKNVGVDTDAVGEVGPPPTAPIAPPEAPRPPEPEVPREAPPAPAPEQPEKREETLGQAQAGQVQQAQQQGKNPPKTPGPPNPGAAAGKGGAQTVHKKGITEVSVHSDCSKARYRGPMKLDFQKAELIDIIKFISDLTCKNFIIPDNLRQAKITIWSPQSVSMDEAYQAFLSALEVNKMTMVQTGKYYKVMGQRESISATIPIYKDEDKYSLDDRMVTKLIKLDFVDANTLTPTLKQLASKEGDIFTYQPTNTLIISDTGNNLFRLEQIIKQLDVPGGEEEIQLVQVNFATASQLAEKLTNIYDIKQGQKPTVTTVPPRVAKGARKASEKEERGELRISKIIADDRTNKLIIIGSAKSFKEISELIKKLDVPVSGEGQVHVYYLDNADAEQIATTMSHLSQGKSGQPRPAPGGKAPTASSADLFSGEVKITADKSTNSLVIVASATDYRNVVNVIRKLDVRRRQVFVEAVIMEVSLDDSKALGVALSGGIGIDMDGKKFPLFGGTMLGGMNSVMFDVASLAQMGGFLTGVQGPPIDGVSLGTSKISIPSFGAVLRALQSNSDVNVLSTPNLLTTDNEEAEILVGQNVPYQSGFTSAVSGTSVNSFNPIVSIQRMDVALKMKIKPQINNSDYVKLNIEEEVSEVTAQDQLLGPTTSKRSAKTVVVAKDQQTVAIGGLIKDNVSVSTSKVPFLGDIPILGWLFRNKLTKTTKTNLILFLTPYIIKDKDDFRKIFERKMKERQEFIQAFYGNSPEYKIHVDYTKKRSPFNDMNNTIDGEMQKAENEGPGVEGQTVITPDGVVEPGKDVGQGVRPMDSAAPDQPAAAVPDMKAAPMQLKTMERKGMMGPAVVPPVPPDPSLGVPPARPGEEKMEVQ